MFGLTRTIDDTPHDRQRHVLGSVILKLPLRHFGADIVLHLTRQLLEKCTCCPTASRAGSHHRRKGTKPHGLQNFLSDNNFLSPRTTRLRSQRNSDRVANAFLKQNGQGSRRCDNTFRPHACFSQAEMKRIIRSLRQFAINGDQVLNAGNLAGQDDLFASQPNLFRLGGRLKRRRHHGVPHYLRCIQWLRSTGIFVHNSSQQILIQAPPVHSDTHWLVIFTSQLDHLSKLLIFFLAEPYVSGIDAVFGQRLSASRVLNQQTMTVIVKIANQWHIAVHAIKVITDFRHRSSGLWRIHGNADQLGARSGQFGSLQCRSEIVLCVRIGH